MLTQEHTPCPVIEGRRAIERFAAPDGLGHLTNQIGSQ
jgi:hypothetical protein